MSELLDVENLTKQFGALVAVDDVSLTVEQGEIYGLIGPNGAGKTTFYNLLTGKLQPTSGSIEFKGEDITSLSPRERVNRGLGRTFQLNNIFDGLTVEENIQIPLVSRLGKGFTLHRDIDDSEEIAAETGEILDLLDLGDIADETCEELGYGDRRRIEIGVGLATDPDLLLLDEPTAGMNPREVQNMVDLIRRLKEETDVTFMITEHNMDVIFSTVSRLVVLNHGSVLVDGAPEAVQGDERVKSAYLGGLEVDLGDGESEHARTRPSDTDPILEVNDIHSYYDQSHVINGLSLDLYEGETVSILGRNGAGKTTTLRSIIGLVPPRRGDIRYHGAHIEDANPFDIAQQGIGYVPQERNIFSDLTVEENINIVLDSDSDWTLERIYEEFPVLKERSNNQGNQLSGGEQQMLAIARALARDPDVLLLDEPSEGLAPVIVDDLHSLVQEITESGISVLLTEQNIDFAMSLSDYSYIIDTGQVAWEGTPDALLDDQSVIDRHIGIEQTQ